MLLDHGVILLETQKVSCTGALWLCRHNRINLVTEVEV